MRSGGIVFLLQWCFAAGLALGCDAGNLTLQSIGPQSLRVSENYSLTIGIDNPSGAAVSVHVEASEDLPSFDRVTNLSNDPGSAIFRWVPLASQTGTHELSFVLTGPGGGSELDRQTALFEVLAAEDAAPVFIRPGAGGTYDLDRDPCVTFDIEVRDDDSNTVDIGTVGELPERATLAQTGDKQATFDWCPTSGQAGSSERWTVRLSADDGEHPPVEHDYMIVLRTQPNQGCPGEAPVVTVDGPHEGDRVTSGASYPVEIRVSDDKGLRDPPLLYFSRTEPPDRSEPDVTKFEQVSFEPVEGDAFVARIPPLGLGEGEQTEVFFLVSATDDDDTSGTTCDHRTETDVIAFIALGGKAPDGSLESCDYCTGSIECASGICASTAGGGRCLEACSGSGSTCETGTCDIIVTREGGVPYGCGPVNEVCGGGGVCANDPREPNDTPQTATPYDGPYTDGQICAGDSDYFAFRLGSGEELVVTLSDADFLVGDLDLTLQDEAGTIVATSTGPSSTEEVSIRSSGGGGTYFARVFGYTPSETNSYSLHASITDDSSTGCTDDAFEDDDTRATARSVTFAASVLSEGASFDGQICSGDDDFIAIPLTGAGLIEVLLDFEHAKGNLDMELYGPGHGPGGIPLRTAASTDDDEELVYNATGPGTYALRIYGVSDASNSYEGVIFRPPQ